MPSGFAGILFVTGIALALGAWLVAMVIASRYGLHSSARFVSGLKRLFSSEGARDLAKLAALTAAMGLGAILTFVGIGMGDAQANAWCREACEDDGYRSGRLRKSPHAERDEALRGPTECWCYRSEQDWSPAPMERPPR